MRTFTNDFGYVAVSPRPYCVWVPVREDNKDRLISIWIDPAMTAFEAQMEPEEAEAGGVVGQSSRT